MISQTSNVQYRFVISGVLITAFFVMVIVTVADASRARRAVTGGAIGAGVGAIVNGGSGARTGAAAGALIGAIR